MFRSSDDEVDREEVIVLVTPHIIQQDADEAASEQIKDDVERFRAGQRKGLRWWGRGRLAQSHMRWAKQALASGDTAKALWNVDMALSLAPDHIEAIRLKERLTDQAYWADEARISTSKYMIQMLMMQELGKPFPRIIPPDKPAYSKDVEPAVQKAFGIGPRYEDPLSELPKSAEPTVELQAVPDMSVIEPLEENKPAEPVEELKPMVEILDEISVTAEQVSDEEADEITVELVE